MIRSLSKQLANCFTIGSTYCWTPGITLTNLGDEARGVHLSPRGKPRAGVTARGFPPQFRNETLLNANLTGDGALTASTEKVESTLVLVSGVTYLEVCCGFRSIRAVFHDQDVTLSLAGTPALKRGKSGGSCLLELPPAPESCYPGDAPAIYLRTITRGEIVIGVTAIERDENGRPALWSRTMREFSQVAKAATRHFDRKLLRLP
jgi:hypothetical protein